MGSWIDQVIEYERKMGRPAPDDDLQRLLNIRAELVERMAEIDRIITAHMIARLAAQLDDDGAAE